jgi:hypothetical protein
MLKQVVHVVTTGLKKLMYNQNQSSSSLVMRLHEIKIPFVQLYKKQ